MSLSAYVYGQTSAVARLPGITASGPWMAAKVSYHIEAKRVGITTMVGTTCSRALLSCVRANT